VTWEAIGALGELIGAFAVFVTVAFLALQMRQNTKALRSESMNSASAATQSWYQQLGANPQATEIWLKGIQSPDQCSQAEYGQFIALLQSYLICHQATFRLGIHGALDTDIRESLNKMLLNLKDQPGFKRFWGERSDQFDAPFQRFVEEAMTSGIISDGSKFYQQAQE
jgi:hypothetical protein